MQTIRSFIAIPLADPVRHAATRMLRSLSTDGDGVKWVPADNVHLTLKFLGEVDNIAVPSICATIEEICEDLPPFELSFAGVSGFPSETRPRMIAIGVADPSGHLQTLAVELDAAMAEHGFKPEPRDYVPHLTLGRARNGRRVPDGSLRAARNFAEAKFGSSTVDQVQLIASFLDKEGPTYQVMATTELGGQSNDG